MRLTVACVKWGTRYSADWVLRLRSMFAKHLAVPHDFVCLTDSFIQGVVCWPLTSGLSGWWAKIELFRPGLFSGPVLYGDLDIVIGSNIDRIPKIAASDPSKLWMRDDFSYSMRNPRGGLGADFSELLGGTGCCNSSVMAWNADAARKVWDTFTPEVMKIRHGDQNHISHVLGMEGIGFLPDDLIGSYKYGQLNGGMTCPITVFHGNPKMDELPKDHELRKTWEAA